MFVSFLSRKLVTYHPIRNTSTVLELKPGVIFASAAPGDGAGRCVGHEDSILSWDEVQARYNIGAGTLEPSLSFTTPPEWILLK